MNFIRRKPARGFTAPSKRGGKAHAGRTGSVGLTSLSSPLLPLAAFLVIVFLLGGGSRHDINSLVLLRPLAIGVAAVALIGMTRGQFQTVKLPLAFLGALVALVAVQLVPLPPGLWMQLEGRQSIAETYRIANISAPWLPLTLSPSRGLNTLLSLSVPLATLLLMARLRPRYREHAIYLLWALAFFSALLGIVQVLGPEGSPLYLYRVTNDGLPVGLFANRNHQALMLGVGALSACWIVAKNSTTGSSQMLVRALSAGSLFVFLPMLLIAGSRAGLLLGVALLFPGMWLIFRAYSPDRARRTKTKGLNVPQLVSVGGAVALAATFVAAIVFSRSLAFDRLLNTNAENEVRAEWLPKLAEIMVNYLPFGAGFGSFEYVYQRDEPTEFLMPSYLNHAHNDWLQFVLEGGILAGALLAVFLARLVMRGWRIKSGIWGGLRPTALVCMSAMIAFGAASVVDYPLRVPSLMAVMAILCALFFLEEGAST